MCFFFFFSFFFLQDPAKALTRRHAKVEGSDVEMSDVKLEGGKSAAGVPVAAASAAAAPKPAPRAHAITKPKPKSGLGHLVGYIPNR